MPCGPSAWYIAPRRAARRPACLPPTPTTTAETDTYRQIYRGHDNASAVTNSEGLTVFFDPDTHDVLGFSIATSAPTTRPTSPRTASSRSRLPAKVPVNLEEEMDFDAEAIRSGVRIAEFY